MGTLQAAVGPDPCHLRPRSPLDGTPRPSQGASSLPPAIAVVGGGIGGLALAVALQRRGLTCRVYERAPALREVGAGLLLTPNAVAVLGAMGLRASVEAVGVITPEWRILDEAGRTLQRLTPFAASFPAMSLTRVALQQVLADAVPPDALSRGHELVGVAVRPDAVALGFRDREAIRADLVVGADGARSRVRGLLWPRRTLRDAGYVGWRALTRGVPSGWEDGRVTETWGRGLRFGIAAVGGGWTYWYASANHALAGPDEPGSRRRRLAALFQGWHAPIAELIAATPDDAILRHAIADAAPGTPCAPGGRVVLLGDAAHPLTPNLGQGAAMALEDAWALAAALAAHGATDASLADYARRRRRWTAIWAGSRLLGAIIQAERPPIVRARAAVLRATPERVASAALGRLMAFDPRSPTRRPAERPRWRGPARRREPVDARS